MNLACFKIQVNVPEARPENILIIDGGSDVAGEYLVESPGMVVMVPTKGYRNPAPTLALTSRMGKVKPVGAPFLLGSDESERWVLAMPAR